MRHLLAGAAYVLMFGLAGSAAVVVMPHGDVAPAQTRNRTDPDVSTVQTVSRVVAVVPEVQATVPTIIARKNGIVEGTLTSIDAASGTTRSISNAVVRFVRDDKVVAEVRSSIDGYFQTELEPGRYGVFAVSTDGFSATGVHVQAWDPATQAGASTIAMTSVLREDIGTVKNLASSFDVESSVFDFPQSQVSGQTASSVSVSVVRLTPEGTLVGSIVDLFDDRSAPRVFMIQSGNVVGTSGVSTDGRFEIGGLMPGDYSLVAADEGRFSAGSLRVVAADLSVVRTVSAEITTADAIASDGLKISLASYNQCNNPCPPAPQRRPIAFFPFNGGGYGGLAGGGAGGATGGALLVGGIGTGVAILTTQDDDGGDGFTPIASPAIP